MGMQTCGWNGRGLSSIFSSSSEITTIIAENLRQTAASALNVYAGKLGVARASIYIVRVVHPPLL